MNTESLNEKEIELHQKALLKVRNKLALLKAWSDFQFIDSSEEIITPSLNIKNYGTEQTRDISYGGLKYKIRKKDIFYMIVIQHSRHNIFDIFVSKFADSMHIGFTMFVISSSFEEIDQALVSIVQSI